MEIAGLPVKGYKPTQSQEKIDLVNEGKELEERVLRYIDRLEAYIGGDRNDPRIKPNGDPRFLATGKTDIQKGFMCVFRSVFNPNRVELPEDIDQCGSA